MRESLQLRLAEITEMIHAASLFHDDVIDEADTRRGVPSVNKVFGNKLAILAGGSFFVLHVFIRNTQTLQCLKCTRKFDNIRMSMGFSAR